MSVFEQGLPAGFFTRWRAVATGLGIAGVVIVCIDISVRVERYTSEPKTAPACYGRQHAEGKKSIPSRGSRDGSGRSIDDRLPGIDADKIALAIRVCTPQSCPSAALKAYRSTMSWYLFYRLQQTTQLYRNYGDAGLARARQIYREPLDLRVEEGLRERYAAGVFRLNDFREHRAAFAMIVFKGGDALRPCRVDEPAEVE